MTKDEILNGMSEQEFYNLYPTKEAWEQAQSQMAYGGSPFIQGFPFGAGITMADGGTPYYGGPLHPAQYGEQTQGFDSTNMVLTGEGDLSAQQAAAAKLTLESNNEYTNTAGDRRFVKNINSPVSTFNANGVAGKMLNTPTTGTVGVNFNTANTNNNFTALPIIGKKPNQILDTNTGKLVTQQKGGVNWPKFKTASEHDKFVARDPNLSLYSQEDLQALGLVRPEAPNLEAIKKQNKNPYRPAGQTASGAGLFNNAQGQQFTFSDGTYNPYSSAEEPIVVERFGGGLPGGPYEMPCMNCGGYMAEGGDSSIFGYGQFPAMQDGGDPNATWLAQEQFALQKKTKQGIPSGVKPTGTNPLYFNPYIKGSDISQPDSMHTSPYDPRIAAYFKGNKMIAGPAENTGPAIQAARKANTGKFYKKDNEIYPNYLAVEQVGGGFINDGSYPTMNMGGIDYSSTINDVFSKYQKKSGGVTSQGGNQNYIKKQQADFYNAIQSNVINKFNQDERDIANQVTQQAAMETMASHGYQYGGGPGMSYGNQPYDATNLDNQAIQNMYRDKISNYQDQRAQDTNAFYNANINLASNIDQNLAAGRAMNSMFDVTPKAQYGKAVRPENYKTQAEYDAAVQAQYDAEIAASDNTQQNMPWFKQFAQEFGPQGRNNGLKYFPANMKQHYQMNKKGKEAFNNLPDNFQMGKLKVTPEYGVLGRTWMGKKLGIGPKRIGFELDGTSAWQNSPNEQGPQVRLSDPTNPLLNPNAEQNPHVILDPARSNNLGPAIQTTPNPNFNWDLVKQAYGGYKAQDGRSVLGPNPIGMPKGVALNGAPPATSFIGQPASAFSTPASIGQNAPEINKFTQADESGVNKVNAKANLNRQWSGVAETLGQYAIPGLNMLANQFEKKDYRNAQKKLEEGTLADNAKLTRSANAFDMGTYQINTGDFRENEKNFSQFPGYNVGKFGGRFQEGGAQGDSWEDDLTEDEIEILKSQGYNVEYLD